MTISTVRHIDGQTRSVTARAEKHDPACNNNLELASLDF